MTESTERPTVAHKRARPLQWGGIAVILFLAIAAIILALPTLKDDLGITVAASEREWLEWGKFFVELVLVLLFGGAVFSEGVGRSIEDTCRKIDASLDAQHTELAAVLQKVSGGRPLTFEDWRTLWSKLLRVMVVGTPVWRNPIGLADLKLMVWLATRGMPRGLFGLIAFLLFVAKVCIDLLLLQGSLPAT